MKLLDSLRRNPTAVGAAALATVAALALVARRRGAAAEPTGRVASVPVYSSVASDVYNSVEPLVEALIREADRLNSRPSQPAARVGIPGRIPPRGTTPGASKPAAPPGWAAAGHHYITNIGIKKNVGAIGGGS